MVSMRSPLQQSLIEAPGQKRAPRPWPRQQFLESFNPLLQLNSFYKFLAPFKMREWSSLFKGLQVGCGPPDSSSGCSRCIIRK